MNTRNQLLAAALALTTVATLGACTHATSRAPDATTCYGTEPDGDHETFRPCPPGWPAGADRAVQEDEFGDLEVDVTDGERAARATRSSARTPVSRATGATVVPTTTVTPPRVPAPNPPRPTATRATRATR